MVTIIDIQNIEVHQDELFNFIKYINDICKSIHDNVKRQDIKKYHTWIAKKFSITFAYSNDWKTKNTKKKETMRTSSDNKGFFKKK